VDEEFWLDRWKSDRIGFHQDEINAALIEHFPSMPWPDGGRIFVPLCGKSEDMVWLREHGQKVVGVEFSSIACRDFFESRGEEFERRDAGRFRLYVGEEEIEIFCGDFFNLGAEKLGVVDGVYDRGAFIALPEEMRGAYAEHMASLVPPGVSVLLLTIEYDAGKLQGPPFSVAPEEVRARFEPAFEVEQLFQGDWQSASANLAERGLDRERDAAWMLTRRDS
jgi:thiopurine S-methyltransferase